MTVLRPEVALLTDQRYTARQASAGDWYFANILHDDELLQKALEKRGIRSARLDWSASDIDWSGFRCLVFRTTWDYYKRFPEFSDWLKIVQRQTRLCNEASTIWWNVDKHYLADLESKGIPVVPVHYLEQGSVTDLNAILEEKGWKEAVVKPCVSGGARYTYRVNQANASTIQQLILPVLKREAFLVQPFVESILLQGEDSLMVIDGEYTHAVRKMPKPGDFRVQDDHGGTVHAYHPDPEQIQLAENAMNQCGRSLSYGRVDMVRGEGGQWQIMELELIEPELWLRYEPLAAENFARAIEKKLS